jgi:transposase
MAAPYSMDLRKRVLAEYDKGELQNGQIAKLFKIDVRTLFNWVQRRLQTGSVAPKKHRKRGPDPKITDSEKLKQFVADNPNSNLKELSAKWGGGVSASAIGRALHRMSITFKKNIWVQRTQ